MLEYCPAGRLWDVVQPLVQQQLQHYLQVPVDESLASNPRRCSVLKPSESFIIQRTKSALEDKSVLEDKNVLEDKSFLEDKSLVEIKCTSEDDSDQGDMSFVHTENSSLLVVSDNQIDHYQYEAENNTVSIFTNGKKKYFLSYA
ncbi:uncharacterized protein LOC111708646 [Eurytemora carolleeae]|uniref:uncharacterized protein LOC111708646 n=1 Tax=Eurytemora carolleeae TaxID=1294199 RepID=UPI000C793F1C|nr:uncharacterized protein LOC111708646 [Eurytemora carolleeae]|eukprot:XP_023337853.1 uncharacterized protein LOC111708646 [Eurytemora affinis]